MISLGTIKQVARNMLAELTIIITARLLNSSELLLEMDFNFFKKNLRRLFINKRLK